MSVKLLIAVRGGKKKRCFKKRKGYYGKPLANRPTSFNRLHQEVMLKLQSKAGFK